MEPLKPQETVIPDERVSQSAGVLAVEAHEVEQSAETAFSAALMELSQELPEIEEDFETIEASGKKLIEKHGLAPELFDRGHTVLFSAIAQQYAYMEEDGALSVKAEEFIDDATIMLAGAKQKNYSESKWLIDTDAAAKEPGKEKAVYEAFTDNEMTGRMRQAISDGLLHDMQEIMPDNPEEIPYDLHVLGIGFSDADDKIWENYEALGWDHAERQRLAENALRFRTEGKMAPAGGSMGWVTRLDGKKVMALPKLVAAMILAHPDNPELVDHKTARHELAHINGDLILDHHESAIGTMAEERRADIAGNSLSYPDIQYFMDIDLHCVTGYALSHTVAKHKFDKDPGAFWTEVASNVGLQLMLELGLAVPDKFVDKERSPLQARLNEYIGGLDGITKRIYEYNLADPEDKADMEARMASHVEWFKQLPVDEAKVWVDYRHKGGMSFMPDIIRRAAA